MMTEYPGIRRPEHSAWVIIRRAIRSLMDPPAEKNSTLATAVRYYRYVIHRASETMMHLERDNIYKTVLTDITFDPPSLCQSAQVDQRGMAYGIGGGIEHARPVVFAVHRTYIALVDGLVLE